MPPGLSEHLPIIIGAGTLTVGGIVTVLKGWKAFLGEVRSVVSDAMRNHEAIEAAWQKAIEERLDRLETKVDRLIEKNGNHAE